MDANGWAEGEASPVVDLGSVRAWKAISATESSEGHGKGGGTGGWGVAGANHDHGKGLEGGSHAKTPRRKELLFRQDEQDLQDGGARGVG